MVYLSGSDGRRRRWLLLAIALFVRTPLEGQVRASELGTVSQTVDGTVLKVEYYRPSLRSRTPFGGIVHWDEKWTPGANWATTFEASRDVYVNGQRVPKGKYSIWLIPRQEGDWTAILHKEARRFHTQRPSEAGEQLRLSITPEKAPETETLTWFFPVVQGDAALLRMHWGTIAIPLRIRVDPTRPRALDAAKRAMYVGEYLFPARDGRPGDARVLRVSATGDGVRGRFEPALVPVFDEEVGLLPVAEHRFRLMVRVAGAVEAEEFYLQFRVTGGRATSVELQGLTDRPIRQGERVK